MRSNYSFFAISLISFLLSASALIHAQNNIRHFIYFGRDRERIKETAFLNNKNITGAQVKYTWKELEPEKDKYDFRKIHDDLGFLTSKGKKLFIQLQDASFSDDSILVPAYIVKDGGVARQYTFKDEDEKEYTPAGWVARRWDPAVQKRLYKLFKALGKEFDGKIEGINLAETAIDFGSGPLHPKGFTYPRYLEAIKENILALKKAFPKSTAMIYANFIPGEFLPWKDMGYMKSIYEFARKNQVAVGGPDLLVYKKGQMNNSYGCIKESSGIVPTGLAVQDGNYSHINPKTNQQVTLEEIYQFAKDYLKLNYIFWCIEEPFYSKQVLPFLEKL